VRLQRRLVHVQGLHFPHDHLCLFKHCKILAARLLLIGFQTHDSLVIMKLTRFTELVHCDIEIVVKLFQGGMILSLSSIVAFLSDIAVDAQVL
jgi:hypothetical protein